MNDFILSIFLLIAVAFLIYFFIVGIQRLVKEFKTMKPLYIVLFVFSLVVDALMIAAIIMAGMIFAVPFVEI